MPMPQLIVLEIVAMAGLATLRVVRFRGGRTPLPDGRGRRLFLLAFVVVPPIALGGIGALPMYVAIIAALAILMWIAALIVEQVATGRSGRLVQVALAGPEGDPYAVRADPAVTTRAGRERADRRQGQLGVPARRGVPGRVSRAGFRDDWDHLDGATRSLEGRIATTSPDRRLLGHDARSRRTSALAETGQAGAAIAIAREGRGLDDARHDRCRPAPAATPIRCIA